MARYGRPAIRLGGGVVIAGLVLLAGLAGAAGGKGADGTAVAVWLILPLSLIGLGNGLVLPPLLGAALREVGPGQAGAASGMVTTGQQFANALGVALLGALWFACGTPVTAVLQAGLVGLVCLLV